MEGNFVAHLQNITEAVSVKIGLFPGRVVQSLLGIRASVTRIESSSLLDKKKESSVE